MKKSILAMGLAALLSLPLAVHGAEAPNHLYGNSGIVNMYDHMGSAVYMYKSSARMVAEDRDTGYIFSVDVKDISYNPEADRFQIQSPQEPPYGSIARSIKDFMGTVPCWPGTRKLMFRPM